MNKWEDLDRREVESRTSLDVPVLELLGWADYLPQQGVAHNEDIPDHLLFADAATSALASRRSTSTSTACRGTTPNTCSTPSPSSAAKTKPPAEHTAPAI